MKRNRSMLSDPVIVGLLLGTVILSCIFIAGCPEMVWHSNPPAPSMQTDFGQIELTPLLIDEKDASSGYEGFRLRVTNDTDEDILIIWQKTFYVMKDQTNGWLFFSGDYYSHASDPKPPDVVFKKSEFTKKVFPVKLLQHDAKKDEWWEDPMPEGMNGLYITFQVKGLETTRRVTADLETVQKGRPLRSRGNARKS